MKARNETTLGPLYSNGVFSANYTSVTDFVSKGALIHGNYKTPNNWAYDVDFVRTFYGTDRGWYAPPFQGTMFKNRSGVMYGESPAVPPWDKSGLYTETLSRLNDKVRGNLDLGVDLAELHSTRKMLAETAKFERWFKGFGAKRWANEWLAFQYGWKPLLGSIYGAAMESCEVVINQLKHVSAKVERPLVLPTFYTTSTGPSAAIPSGYPVQNDGYGKYVCVLKVSLRNPSWDLARWTSLNPLSLAWELLPYSFVVDWFIDVGSYLRDFETACLYNLRFVNGYRADFYSWRSRYTVRSTRYDSNGQRHEGNLDASRTKLSYTRTNLASYPFPLPPRLDAKLGSQRLLSAAALLTQFLGRR